MLAETRPSELDARPVFRLALAAGITVERDGAEIRVAQGEGLATQLLRAQLTDDAALRLIAYNPAAEIADQRRALLAALSAVFGGTPELTTCRLDPAALPGAALDALRASGVLADDGVCLRDGWAQQADLWLENAAGRTTTAPLYRVTEGLRHPRRAPCAAGPLYRRDLPVAEGRRFTLRGLRLKDDAARIGGWFDEPRVRAGWGDTGAPSPRAYLERQLDDPHVAPLVGCFDDEPFAYVEACWLKEDPLSPHLQPGDYDRGLRMLVGEPRWRGAEHVAAWLPSVVHYLFLDDPRTSAVVCVPSADHERLIGYLARHGFAQVRHLDLPRRQAVLMRTVREAFFSGRHV
ncbi:GNAT family N-acetyltransferase [Burkholderia alba]|uniref:GNAT family N-acetyltransferase n=1 Tax=Burkholderia alba TaxID=2683677 RepID=UPI002B05D225|nr:GNAT family N-acetyltransferase [Burkholderia alba]